MDKSALTLETNKSNKQLNDDRHRHLHHHNHFHGHSHRHRHRHGVVFRCGEQAERGRGEAAEDGGLEQGEQECPQSTHQSHAGAA